MEYKIEREKMRQQNGERDREDSEKGRERKEREEGVRNKGR